MGRAGFDSVRFSGKLIHAVRDGREKVFERSGRTVFSGALERNPATLRKLLHRAGLPTLEYRRLNRTDLAGAQAMMEAAPGPWRIRASSLGDDAPRGITVEKVDRLEAAWAQLPETATRVTIEQTPRGSARSVLMVGGQPLASVLISPPSVTGDGTTSLGQLIERKVTGRAEHPYLRHFPLKASLLEDDRLARKGLSRDDVPTAGQRVQLARSPDMSLGADAECLPGPPDPELAEMARVTLGLIGRTTVTSVTFANMAKPDDTEPSWVVWTFDPDPIVAQFAVAGGIPGGEIYDSVVSALMSGRHYSLTMP